MLAAAARLLPATRYLARQIVPPVIATLIAAVLIAGYNHTFSGHLVQPRMAAVQGEASAASNPAPASNTVPMTKPPREAVAETVIETFIVDERAALPDRIFAKDEDREAGKDQTLKLATAVEPAPPAPPVAAAPRSGRKGEPQAAEPRAHPAPANPRPVIAAPAAPMAPVAPAPVAAAPVASAPVASAPMGPVVVAPAPVPVIVTPMGQPVGRPIPQEPPPVIAARPYVTVPDRPRPAYGNEHYAQQPPYAPQYEPEPQQPQPPRQNVIGTVVDNLKPSSILARMREFGDKIEAAGNEILPNIRQ